ncbi:hypothetical protein RFI_17883 [Reticulomyxa filosa]|uniref:Uncharacterized protein n=1 Tax=Reticulomyxa filosa TaxID=46433 RepID=X6N222_RETFI|nr:hypothetical protein RFI_17883 [Reticulomyxa filosa]|eukprot:ETO19347.1 hypothetical protein RFI_17883 [Reticulomyxa filosa]
MECYLDLIPIEENFARIYHNRSIDSIRWHNDHQLEVFQQLCQKTEQQRRREKFYLQKKLETFVRMFPLDHQGLCTEKECFEPVLENSEMHLRMKFMDQTVVQPRNLVIKDVVDKERLKEIRQTNKTLRKDAKKQKTLQEQRRRVLLKSGQIHTDFSILFVVPPCWRPYDFRFVTMAGEKLVANLDIYLFF